jgi:hypothetical protein
MIVVVALVLAALFGGGDQYLGSMSWHPWAAVAVGVAMVVYFAAAARAARAS